jgi:hypothetical protein
MPLRNLTFIYTSSYRLVNLIHAAAKSFISLRETHTTGSVGSHVMGRSLRVQITTDSWTIWIWYFIQKSACIDLRNIYAIPFISSELFANRMYAINYLWCTYVSGIATGQWNARWRIQGRFAAGTRDLLLSIMFRPPSIYYLWQKWSWNYIPTHNFISWWLII